MRMDVVELINFYTHTELGKRVSEIINKTLSPLIAKNSNEFIIGFGFTCPFMECLIPKPSYEGDHVNIISLMPGGQGVVPWPKNSKNLAVLVDETSWPLNTSSAEIILIAHGLEVSGNQNYLLEEAFRVLDSKGKLVLLVPNRTGFWARSDNTPFGFGKPYTVNQLNSMLSKSQFQIDNIFPVLYGPPAHSGYWLKSMNFWETVGKKFNYPFFGGIFIVEASKSVFGTHKISAENEKKFSSFGKYTVAT